MGQSLPSRALPAARAILRTMGPLVRDERLWTPGERLAVAVSGGKDSLALLALILAGPELGLPAARVTVLHLPPPLGCPCAVAAADLPARLAALGLAEDDLVIGPPSEVRVPPLDTAPAACSTLAACPAAVRGDCIAAHAVALARASVAAPRDEGPCPACARARRRWLLETCRDRDLRVLALAHHQDDLAQTLLLNLLFHAEADAVMQPSRVYLAGRLRLVRPLLTTPERRVIAFARRLDLLSDPCSSGSVQPDGQRARVRAFLHGLGTVRELAKNNLARLARRRWLET